MVLRPPHHRVRQRRRARSRPRRRRARAGAGRARQTPGPLRSHLRLLRQAHRRRGPRALLGLDEPARGAHRLGRSHRLRALRLGRGGHAARRARPPARRGDRAPRRRPVPQHPRPQAPRAPGDRGREEPRDPGAVGADRRLARRLHPPRREERHAQGPRRPRRPHRRPARRRRQVRHLRPLPRLHLLGHRLPQQAALQALHRVQP